MENIKVIFTVCYVECQVVWIFIVNCWRVQFIGWGFKNVYVFCFQILQWCCG